MIRTWTCIKVYSKDFIKVIKFLASWDSVLASNFSNSEILSADDNFKIGCAQRSNETLIIMMCWESKNKNFMIGDKTTFPLPSSSCLSEKASFFSI